jgi:methylated-DNA-[protein]-cysteine S-methyltransferase
MNLAFKWMESQIGPLKLVGSDMGLAAILWENDSPRRVRLRTAAEDNAHPLLTAAERQLAEYFRGERENFEIPLAFAGTPFQIKVWQALLTIPYGETRSYSEVARHIGYPTAMRAVGAANGRNPIAIVAPCHRVIGASGSLTGFAGGLEAKRYLLDLEAGRARGAHSVPRVPRDSRGLALGQSPSNAAGISLPIGTHETARSTFPKCWIRSLG